MDKPENQLAVQDEQVAVNDIPVLPELANDNGISAVNAKYRLLGARLFVAANAGVPAADCKKKSMAQVIELAVANGATEADCKAWRAEFNALEARHEKISRATVAVYASDSNWKSKMSVAINAKGVPIGINASFRKLGVKSAIARLAQADKRVAELEAQLAARALPA